MEGLALIILTRIVSITLALLFDHLLGDPHHWPHPVRWFGRWISWMDQRLNKGKKKKVKGSLLVISMAFWTIGVAGALVYANYQLHLFIGILIEAILIYTTIAPRSLAEAAMNVARPLALEDMETARKEVGMIVGRDTDRLTQQEIARAAVETVAENTSDGVTAPLFFAFIGGGPLALFYRAINTCDSMVGYKNERYGEFGYFSAKCDDVLNYIPSRMTALVMAMMNVIRSPFSLTRVFSIIRRDARKHPSPNSGYGESAMAALLGIQLGGTNTYQGIASHRPRIGDPVNEVSTGTIEQSIEIMRRTVYGFVFFFVSLGGVIIAALTWS
ncbi:adenosylcobinamide-phosphate synthase CbiB [Priestia abyssalis]|uniref:adenosylcobinamide-phosphate synthase CbiB n=1 Tax=Priestia abyssalis TaxID=1221450 RepID=UPI0009951EA2|nr:adenosylcobinamide-phosphate synthase CbiB [Priestia abyssalis]